MRVIVITERYNSSPIDVVEIPDNWAADQTFIAWMKKTSRVESNTPDTDILKSQCIWPELTVCKL